MESLMQTNVGDTDRAIRVAAGVLLLSLLFFLDGSARWIGLIGLMPLASGLSRWCPLYSALNITSYPADRPRR
jgi:hypothetical protein